MRLFNEKRISINKGVGKRIMELRGKGGIDNPEDIQKYSKTKNKKAELRASAVRDSPECPNTSNISFNDPSFSI